METDTLPPLLAHMAQELISTRFFQELGFQVVFSMLVYTLLAALFAWGWPRRVTGRRPTDLLDPQGDLRQSLVTAAVASFPITAFVRMDHCRGWAPTPLTGDGWTGWALYALQAGVFFVVLDFGVFFNHWMNHQLPWLYDLSHAVHHTYRPPVAWSAAAVDVSEGILGMGVPFMLTRLLVPCPLPMSYACMFAIQFWSVFVHSASHWPGNWLLLGPLDHQLHHKYGINAMNHGAVLTLWDRLTGTLRRGIPELKQPYWILEEMNARNTSGDALLHNE